MNKKAITPFLFAAFAILIISSCENGQDKGTDNIPDNGKIIQSGEFDWNDNHVVSFSDVHNPMSGYTSDDAQSLDTAFIEMLWNDIVYREDVEFLDPIDEKKISAQHVRENILKRPRVTQLEDVNNPGVFDQILDTIITMPSDIVQLICREEWQFDKKAMRLQKKISHIAPVARTYDSEGNERGKIILFWIKLN